MRTRNKEIIARFVLNILASISTVGEVTPKDERIAKQVIDNIKDLSELSYLIEYMDKDNFMEPYTVNNKAQLKDAEKRLRAYLYKLEELTTSKIYL